MGLKIYASRKCKPCVVLKRILREWKISFESVNADTIGGYKELMKNKVEIIPTLEINGNRMEGLPQDLTKVKNWLKENGLEVP